MLEELWNGILDLATQFVIPDWGALIALLPIFVLVLIVAVLGRTFARLLTAKPARRGQGPDRAADACRHPHAGSVARRRSSPRSGAALLFLGLVFEGPILVLGAIALVLTLLYWLAEALHIYDHDLGATSPALPAVVHDGPPPGVHMPGPSFRPFLGALGATMLMLGLVFGAGSWSSASSRSSRRCSAGWSMRGTSTSRPRKRIGPVTWRTSRPHARRPCC